MALPDSIVKLIRDEQARQAGRFVEGVDMDSYLAKLAGKAEIVADHVGDRCRGVAAFYCNDLSSRQAFMTLLLVDPADRGLGIGQALVAFVLHTARRRGFRVCRLEVSLHNHGAREFYRALGFQVAEERGEKQLLEINLGT